MASWLPDLSSKEQLPLPWPSHLCQLWGHWASGVPAEGACCPLPHVPSAVWLLSATEGVDNTFMEWFGLEETSGGSLPEGGSNLLLRSVPTLNWGKEFHGTVAKLAALSVTNITEKGSSASFWGGKTDGHFCSSFYSTASLLVLKLPFIFPNSSAPQNLHQWERTAEEEKITRKVLNASSPKELHSRSPKYAYANGRFSMSAAAEPPPLVRGSFTCYRNFFSEWNLKHEFSFLGFFFGHDLYEFPPLSLNWKSREEGT